MLGLTPEQLFKQYLVVDQMDGTLMLLPRRVHQDGGEMIGWRETHSVETPCVFLDIPNGNACRIHDVKPVSCREFKCWEKGSHSGLVEFPKEQILQLGWSGYDPDEYE